MPSNRKTYRHEYYLKNKEKSLFNGREWRKNNLERKRRTDKLRRLTLNDKYSTYKANAKNRGLIFDLSKIVFEKLINNNCFYCGQAGFGVDRVDSTVGYLEFNCVSCCTRCNWMKLNLSVKDFIDHCKLIAKNN